MHVVIGISLGTLAAMVLIVLVIFSAWRAEVRKRKLRRLRAKQEVARQRALEKSLRPPLSARLQMPFGLFREKK